VEQWSRPRGTGSCSLRRFPPAGDTPYPRAVGEALQLLAAVSDQLTLDVEGLVLVHGWSFRIVVGGWRDGASTRYGDGRGGIETGGG